MFFSLLKIYLKNLYAPGIFFEGLKKDVKTAVKNIIIILIALYGIFVFLQMLFFMAKGSYSTLETVGKEGFMPAVAFIISAISLLFFGFTSVASNYYSGSGDEQFFAMPISGKTIFKAKFALSFITDAVFGAVILSLFSFVYAFHQGLFANPLFYLGLIVLFSASSMIFLAVIYALLISALLLFPALRKRSLLTGFATALLIVFIIIYSFFAGFSGGNAMATADSGQIFMPLALKLASLAERIRPLYFFSTAIQGNLLPILILLLISAAIILGILPLLGSLYLKTLAGFSDVKSKKLTSEKAVKVIQTESKTNSAFKALLLRDVRTVLREPVFLSNGPLLVFIFPLVFIISIAIPLLFTDDISFGTIIAFAQSYIQTQDLDSLNKIYYFAGLGLAGFIIFTGSSTNIAATAFSREGKSITNLKAMPVTFETILKVKFWHSLIYIIAASVIYLVILLALNLIFNGLVPWADLFHFIVYVLILAVSTSILLIFLDLILDAANPKLNWENPAAAFKQNLNSLIAMLFSFLILGIFAGLAFLLPKKELSMLVMSLFFIIIAAPLGSLYFRYGVKRLRVM
ncbi:MAG: hypothetical protein IJ688_10970 [Treponema sp.]|nr:hypothetical protein [Treponema sp.]